MGNKVSIANVQNDNHIEMYKLFDSTNGTHTLNLLKKSLKKENFEVKENIFTEENNTIIDTCYIEGNKDLKSFTLVFPTLETKKERKLIKEAELYAFDTLGAETIFITTNDKNIINSLKNSSYEIIEETEEEVIFEKDKEYQDINKRGISHNGRN